MPSLTSRNPFSRKSRSMKPTLSSQRLPQTGWLILFDGICGWCTGWIRFLITRDTEKKFQFAPLQSPLGQQFLSKYELPQQEFSTFVVVTPDGHLTKSTAALNIARQLGGIWPIFSVFLLLPKNLRDGVYDFIARHRYQLRGTLDACYAPPEEHRDRFRYDV